MTLQEFIDFDLYVRCFTFGKTDITPVAYDPRERRYLVEHDYLSPELGARVVRDAQTINQALGYEMNTIEFAVRDGVPYAIDYLNPAPDFERDRITAFYFAHVVEKMASLVDRSRAERRPVAVLAALGRDAGHRTGVRLHRRAGTQIMDAIGAWHALLRPDVELSRAACAEFAASMRARKLTFGDRIHCPFLRPFFLTEQDEARMRAAAETIAALGERVVARGARIGRGVRPARPDRRGDAARADRSGVQDVEHGVAARRVPAARFAALRRIQRRVAGRPRRIRSGSASSSMRCRSWRGSGKAAASGSTRRSRRCSTRSLASYREWGGTAAPPTIAIVDWRNVPTWTEFEILRDAFVELGVPTVVCDPRDLSFDGRR